MTKRERLYHSLVKSGKLSEHKLAKKKLKYAIMRKKPSGILIDMAYNWIVGERVKFMENQDNWLMPLIRQNS